MDQRSSTTGAGSSLPLASLRLMASPLQLTYSYIWQVMRQKNVKNYGKVEGFVTMVTETVPDLLSFKQTAQLILGLRARIILDLLQKDGPPNTKAIQTLINKLKVSTTAVKNEDVEKSQTSFLVLVQNLLKNPNERKRFFKETFPVHYGAKFDTALQALTAGLVCKLEQLVPVPNLSQLGNMIGKDSTVLDACGDLIPHYEVLKTLLLHQQSKGAFAFKASVSTSVGDCVLSSLAFMPKPAEATPPAQPSQSLMRRDVTVVEKSPASLSDGEGVGGIYDDDDSPALSTDRPQQEDQTSQRGGPQEEDQTSQRGGPQQEDQTSQRGGPQQEDQTSQRPVSGNTAKETSENLMQTKSSAQQQPATTPQSKENDAEKPENRDLQQPPQKSIPFKIVQVPVKSVSTLQTAGGAGTKDGQKPQTQRVTLHQWVSQIASNTMSLPALPPLPAGSLFDDEPRLSIRRKKQFRHVVDRYNCTVCDKSFPYQSKLMDHQRIHTGEKPFTCPACNKSFRTQGFLNNHLKTHSTMRPYACGQCGKCFAKLQSLTKHILAHNGQKPFFCNICNKGFTQSTYFKRHMECHTSHMTFPCKHCSKTFPTVFKLTNHERWHTRDRPHMCERCGKRFLVPSLLKRHMGYHIGDRQYLCSQCGKTFVYLSDLKRHQQDHIPKAKIPCPVCQKKFSSKYCLRVHLRIHTRERPYRCTLCDKTFTQVGNLKVHIRLHTNERPFSCDVCGKTYKLASHLNVHKRTHTCKKPWTCDTCGKGFSVPGLLKKHEQLHTREANPDFARKRAHRGKHKKHSLDSKYEVEEEGSDDY